MEDTKVCVFLSGEKGFPGIEFLFAILTNSLTMSIYLQCQRSQSTKVLALELTELGTQQTWFISSAWHFQHIFNKYELAFVWFLSAVLKQTVLELSRKSSLQNYCNLFI